MLRIVIMSLILFVSCGITQASYWVFDNQNDGQFALDTINSNYGCPIKLENGYMMDTWTNLQVSKDNTHWYFEMPIDRPDLNKTAADAMNGVYDYTLIDSIPADWI